MPPRILIADDSAATRKLVRACLEAEPGWCVCAEAGNGREAIGMALKYHPNVIVMDLSMPVMNGLDAARIIRRLLPSASLIMFTFFSTSYLEKQAMEAGYQTVIVKTQRLEDLVGCIRSIAAEAA